MISKIWSMLCVFFCEIFSAQDFVLQRKYFSLLNFSDFRLRYFWNWTYFSSYVQFMCIFVCVTGAMTFTFLEFHVFVESLGFLALTTEAMLAVPQFVQNMKNRSTKGMR